MPFNPSIAFAEIGKADPAAVEFLEAYYAWCHNIDDLWDRDKPLTPEGSLGIQLRLIEVLAGNTFFARHKAALFPVIMVGFLAWVASEDRRQVPDVLERITAQVLKSQYQDVFYTAAYLVGGWGHAAAMSRKYREYSFDREPVKV